jgi:prepilin-type processing-associated H-X9-DG protein
MLKRWAWCLSLFLAAGLALAAPIGKVKDKKPYDWPQWQGLERTAVSREKGLLPGWPKKGPELAWKATGLGAGFSTPSIAGDRIFTMGNRGRTEYVIALSEKDGKELWATEVGPVRAGGGGYPGPRCTPTVDGASLYALGLNGDLVCLEVAKGKERWRKNLVKDFAGQVGGWGYSESPLVDGDKVICTPGGKKATLVALNKKDGETIWTAQVPQGDGAHYSSVIAANVGKQRQYIQFLRGGVVGVAAADGEFLWRYNHPANGTANCSTPIYHDGHVFAASSYGVGGGLVKLTKDGNKVKAEEVYFTKHMKNHHGGIVLLNGYLYGSNEGVLACLDFKTGEVMWEDRHPGKGSIAYADGRLYYRNEGGPIVLVEANPKKYVEKGRFNQPDRSRMPAWPHPVIANGKLYIRDQDILLCYNVKKQ